MAGNRERLFELACSLCGSVHTGHYVVCCPCGGIVEPIYDLDRVELRESPNPYERFRDLLPIVDFSSFPQPRTEYTPCIHAREFGKFLKLPNLYLKDESIHPTGSTKDRSAAVSLQLLRECGVSAFVTSTTGNAGTAYTHAIQEYDDLRMYMVVGESFRDRTHFGNSSKVVPLVLEEGTFVDAGAFAKALGRHFDIPSDGGFFNHGKREGLKLAFFEATDQIGQPIDWYVQTISSGMGVYGTYTGARQLLQLGRIEELPRLLNVQESTCSPQVRAWEAGSEVVSPGHIVDRPTGIALASHRGDPRRSYPHMRRVTADAGGTFVDVTEEEIREARKIASETEGVEICFTASAAVAGVIKMARQRRLPGDHTVLINLTGRDRQPEQDYREPYFLRRTDNGWKTTAPQSQIPEFLPTAPEKTAPPRDLKWAASVELETDNEPPIQQASIPAPRASSLGGGR